MTATTKKVVRSDLSIDSAFDRRLGLESDVRLAVFTVEGAREVCISFVPMGGKTLEDSDRHIKENMTLEDVFFVS